MPEFISKKIVQGLNQAFFNLWNIVEKHNAFIAGGYAKWAITRHVSEYDIPNDIDIYLRQPEDYKLLLDELLNSGYQLTYESIVSIQLLPQTTDGDELLADIPNKAIQLIKPLQLSDRKFFGTPEEVISGFDFSVSRVALISKSEALADEDFDEDSNNSFLRIKHMHFPPRELLRISKYSRKGYYVTLDTIRDVLKAWDDYDPKKKQLFMQGKLSNMNEFAEESELVDAANVDVENYDNDEFWEDRIDGDFFYKIYDNNYSNFKPYYDYDWADERFDDWWSYESMLIW